MKNVDLVILAGGKGSRIKEYLKNKPKPMLKFNNINFLQYIINKYSKYPFQNIYILTGFKSKIIFKNYHNKIFNFIKIKCIKENKLMGTGGALYKLKKEKINNFVLINGDTIFDIDLLNFINSHKKNSIGSLALTNNSNNINSLKLRNLSINKNLIKYDKKSKLMNGGIYFFKKKILKLIPNKNCSLENDILPKLIERKKIAGKFYNEFFLDIGTPKYLKKTSMFLKSNFSRPAAFLDRDGVINHDYGYVHKIKNFKFKDGVIKGLKYLIKKNYYIFIITNQAGIAKNIFHETDFFSLQKVLKKKLALNNIFFDDVQYCPYHPNGVIKKFKRNSPLRKPNNRMIENIFEKWLVNKQKSFMIGDKLSDKKCAYKSELHFSYNSKNFFKQVKKILKYN